MKKTAERGRRGRHRRHLTRVPRRARYLVLSGAVGSLPLGVMLVLYPLYLRQLGLPAVQIGHLFTLVGLSAAVVMLVGGPLVDRLGRRPFLLAGTALPILGFALFALTTDRTWIVVASLLGSVGFAGGLGGALVLDTLTPTLSGTVGPRRRTTLLSWAKAAWTLFIGVGMILAGLPNALARGHPTAELAADRWLFVLCLVATLVATGLLLPVMRAPARERVASDAGAAAPAERAASPAQEIPLRRCLPLILKITVFRTLQGAGLGLAMQLLPLWFALRFHAHTSAIAPWYAAAQFAAVPAVLVVPTFTRRWTTAQMVTIPAALGALALAGLALAPLFLLAGLCLVLRAAILSMQWSAQRSFTLGAVPPRHRGTAISLAVGCWSVAVAVLPTVAGLLLDQHRLRLPLLLGVACYAASALWFWLTLRQTSLPEESEDPAEHAGAEEHEAVPEHTRPMPTRRRVHSR